MGTNELGDTLGQTFASGDFDNNGFADPAIDSLEEAGAVDNSGAANVIYGRPGGLGADGHQLWSRDSIDVLDQSEENNLFGPDLAPGDFDLDGFDVLAIDVRDEDHNGVEDLGAVNVPYRSSPEDLIADLTRQKETSHGR